MKNKLIMMVIICAICFSTAGVHVNAQNADALEILKLIQQLKSDNFGISLQAHAPLVEYGDAAVLSLKRMIRTEPYVWNRVKAVNILGEIGTEASITAMLSGIGDRETSVYESVVKNVEKLSPEGLQIAKVELISLLLSTDFNIRSRALDLLLLSNIGIPEIASGIVNQLSTATLQQQDLGLKQLAKLGPEAGSVIPELVAVMDSSEHTDQLPMLDTIGAIGGERLDLALPIFREILFSDDWDLRQEAIWGMRFLGLTDEEMVVLVEPLLTEPASQNLAVEVIAQLAITQPAAVETLADILADQSYSQNIREQAYYGLKGLIPQLEWHIDRGLVAVYTDPGVYLSWRFLGTDAAETAFDVYRNGTKINETPITQSTNFVDSQGTLDSTYYVVPVLNNVELAASETAAVWEQQYLSIPLSRPEGGVAPNGERYAYNCGDLSVADITGDGRYEIIVKWEPSNFKDNSHDGWTGNVYIDAYTLDGELLWRIDLGHNVRAGLHYSPFLVYDFDNDGRIELVVKTADGTVDSTGKVIGDPNVNYRNARGRIITGPEYLTVFDATTGAELTTIDYKPARGNVSDWGDSYGNRSDRYLAAVAFLDGVNPSIIMSRGYYVKTVIVAYNFVDGKLEELWTFDTTKDPALKSWEGQGNHQLSVADVDGDGRQEIIFGAMTIDDDGTGLYNTRLGHGDALHVADHDPFRPGLEVFGVHENTPNYAGINLRDARTGEIFWGIPTDYDVGRGVAANIDPRYPGSETFASRTPIMDMNGQNISSAKLPLSFVIWWDGDLQRELLDFATISKWNWETNQVDVLLTEKNISAITEKPPLQVDILGDWREEVIWRTNDSSEMRIYTTTDETEHRLFTLMHDPMYRMAIAWQNVAYNQPPHPSFYVGEEMEPQTFNFGQVIAILEQYATEFDN